MPFGVLGVDNEAKYAFLARGEQVHQGIVVVPPDAHKEAQPLRGGPLRTRASGQADHV
jgi:hypothetical protein